MHILFVVSPRSFERITSKQMAGSKCEDRNLATDNPRWGQIPILAGIFVWMRFAGQPRGVFVVLLIFSIRAIKTCWRYTEQQRLSPHFLGLWQICIRINQIYIHFLKFQGNGRPLPELNREMWEQHSLWVRLFLFSD